ncbi:LOW QUALITY PROTEIN: hypothetical protein HID58_049004, partial [Brassica napus]
RCKSEHQRIGHKKILLVNDWFKSIESLLEDLHSVRYTKLHIISQPHGEFEDHRSETLHASTVIRSFHRLKGTVCSIEKRQLYRLEVDVLLISRVKEKDVDTSEEEIDEGLQEQDPPAGISGAPQDNNIMLWNAVIFGPDDTPWDGGTFKLSLQFSEDYPNKPPTVRFVSRMFHPNIYADGSICLDILQNQWSPIYDVAAILTSIQSLLCDPNPNSPANSEAARMFSESKREYNRRVREVVEQSWTAD